MALHTGIAAFHCGECGKAFITRDKLLLHQKSRHSNERPHACEWCGKGFLLAHKLAEHRRRVHTGEKPFKCNMCDQRFTDSRYVTRFYVKPSLQKWSNFSFFFPVLFLTIVNGMPVSFQPPHVSLRNRPSLPPTASRPSSSRRAATRTRRWTPRMRPQQPLQP